MNNANKLTSAQEKMLQQIAAGTFSNKGGMFSTLKVLRGRGFIAYESVNGSERKVCVVTAAGYNALGAVFAPIVSE